MTFHNQVPKHKHIYCNGFICLSILYKDWSPALNVNTVCWSIISMLSSAKVKESPPNDGESFKMRYKGRSPKELNWYFEDDKC